MARHHAHAVGGLAANSRDQKHEVPQKMGGPAATKNRISTKFSGFQKKCMESRITCSLSWIVGGITITCCLNVAYQLILMNYLSSSNCITRAAAEITFTLADSNVPLRTSLRLPTLFQQITQRV
jgi:hypothetical protein